MIRQEKRKRRWLEKNGFTIVTEDNKHLLEPLSFLYKKQLLTTSPIFAYKESMFYKSYVGGFEQDIYILARGRIEHNQLHEIKLEYIHFTTDPHDQKKIRRAISQWCSDVTQQWAALIKHGINPWW